jgi:hypothetical protein
MPFYQYSTSVPFGQIERKAHVPPSKSSRYAIIPDTIASNQYAGQACICWFLNGIAIFLGIYPVRFSMQLAIGFFREID